MYTFWYCKASTLTIQPKRYYRYLTQVAFILPLNHVKYCNIYTHMATYDIFLRLGSYFIPAVSAHDLHHKTPLMT